MDPHDFDWEKAEGLPEEAPLGRIFARQAQPTSGYVDPIREVQEYAGLECAFCCNPMPVFVEGDTLVALYQLLTPAQDGESGTAYFVCADCCATAAAGAPEENVTFYGGVTTVYAEGKVRV